MKYKRIPLGPLWTNSFILDDEAGTAICTDVGGDPEDVIAYLKREKLTLKAILLTHCHMDHILGLADLKRFSGAEIYVPEDDLPLLTNPDLNLASEFGRTVEAVHADHIVREGDCFTVGGIVFRAMHTPGHTSGSTCYVASQGSERLLLSGDTLFARSIGRTDLVGGDEVAMTNSLCRLKALEGDMPVLPGHGPETRLQREREENPFM